MLLLLLLLFSWELASALKESKARFDSAGVKLIAVGVGSPDKARILAERVSYFSHFSHHNVSQAAVHRVVFHAIIF